MVEIYHTKTIFIKINHKYYIIFIRMIEILSH